MPFYADLHIHSKYSRACSKDCDLIHLSWWARRKGIGLVGTGDFTHPAWFSHLQEMLVPAEPGLFALRPDADAGVLRGLPASCHVPVRFMLSVEISTIYKRDGATRKVHHLVYVPSFDAAAEFNRRLGRIGNLGSDGRPILGLDSRDLLEITLECADDAYLVPAHIWTPWFAVLGSKSGFDAVADCYADLAGHIFALETGLSSDPAMNWRLSALDGYRLVSNSDAHSPPILGREASVFGCDLDYFALKRALETGADYLGTIEVDPAFGKYHVDGHRRCGVRLDPAETRELGGRCPECGKPVTVGVLHRVEELADRPEPAPPAGAAGYRNLLPLPEVMSELLGCGPRSKTVLGEIAGMVSRLGPELVILDQLPIEEIAAAGHPLLAEAVHRLRAGRVLADPGYDGEYGTVRLFEPAELAADTALFDLPAASRRRPRRAPAGQLAGQQAGAGAEGQTEPPDRPGHADPDPEPAAAGAALTAGDGTVLSGLDPDQRAAAGAVSGPLLIVAGPGTGKTRTLTHRIAHLATRCGAAPQRCLAVTFTRRAADEMAERLAALFPGGDAVTVTTFHGLGVRILREQHARAGLAADFRVADAEQRLAVLRELTGSDREARRTAGQLSRLRRGDAAAAPELTETLHLYLKALRARDLVDFDDLITLPVALLEAEPDVAAHYRDRYRWISVDEYQDVDAAQYRLLRLLAGQDGDLCVIGDPDQAIYSFRGADVGFFLRFRDDFPSARTVTLTRNYRSSPAIVTAALQAIAPGTLVPGRTLLPCRSPDRSPDCSPGRSPGRSPGHPSGHGAATRIGLYPAADAADEAAFVVRTIDRLLGGQSFHSLDSGRVDTGDGVAALSLSEIAVLYRTDAQAAAVMEALTRVGLPFQKRSHDRLSDRPGVPAIVRDLRYRSTTDPTPTPVARRLREAGQAALGLLPASPDGAPPREAAAEIHSALDLLAPLAAQCGDDVGTFLTELALGAEVDTWDPRADRVSLLTLHAAKGLEFPVVFVVGCEEGLLPLRWPGAGDRDQHADAEDEESVREERRLFFVGLTRARDHLYLSHARVRARGGATRPVEASRFLAAFDPALLDRAVGTATTRTRPQGSQLRLL